MTRQAIDRDVLLAEPSHGRDALTAGRRLVEELPRPRRSLGLLVGLTLLEVTAQVLVALLARSLLLRVTTGGADGLPVGLTVGALLAALLAYLVVRARYRLQERLAVQARGRAVRRLARHLHRADVQDLSATPMAGLREILMTDVDFAYRFGIETVAQLTVLLAWLVATVALTAWLSPALLLVLTALGAAVAVGVALATRRHLALTAQRFPRLAATSQRARDVVEVERVVVARQFGLRELFVRQFLAAHDAFLAVALAQGRVTASVRAAVASLSALSFVALVVIGGSLVLHGGLAVGSLVAVLFVLGQLLAAVAAFGDFSARFAETATAGRRLLAFWDDPSDVPEPVAMPAGRRVEQLVTQRLDFGYGDGPAVLSAIDVRLRRGRPAALTAATGAGKSTLALLLTGVLHPDGGHVEADDGEGGVRAPQLLPAGRVLHVASKPVLVPGSILDNLLLDEERRAATDVVALTRFVAEVTQGALRMPVDAPVVGPNGTGLSSGQAQLVQLARAVHRDPDVVVFDEATSALDMETEARVQQGLLDWCRQRVCLVVSHRRCPWTDAALDQLHLVSRPGRPGLTLEQSVLQGAPA